MLSTVFAGLLLGPAASAQQTQVVVVWAAADKADSRQASLLAQHVVDELRKDARLELIEPAEETSVLEARRRHGEAGQRFLGDIARKREGRDSELTADAWAKAVEELQKSDWRTTHKEFVHAFGWLSALNRSEADLKFVLAMERDFRDESMDPETARYVDDLRKKVTDEVEFQVVSDAPAIVWIDGALRGVAPFSAKLAAGRHRFTATAPGKRLYQEERLIDVNGAVVRLSLVDGIDAASTRTELDDINAGLRTGDYLVPIKRFVAHRKVSNVLVVGFGRTESKGREVRLVRMDDKGRASVVSRAIGEGAEDDAKVSSLVIALFDHPVGVNLTDDGLISAGPGRRTAGFVSLGTGAALTIAGAILAIVGASQFSQAQSIPQIEQTRYAQATSNAQGFLGAGIATGAVGLIGLGLGSILLATSPPAPTLVADPE